MKGLRIKSMIRKCQSSVWSKPQPQRLKTEIVWSIGLYAGNSPFQLTSLENISNPVLTRDNVTDVPAAFVADPFMIKANDVWYMYFEVKNRRTDKGEIALARSKNGLDWHYEGIVLTEPFHMSYPYVFEWMNDYYLIPESHKAKSVRLYRSFDFPTRWSFVANLLSDQAFLDPSIFRYRGKWWLFAGTNGERKHDTLLLYYADELTGPWFQHPKSPIIRNNGHIARPGGRVLAIGDKVIRYAQDCYPDYGAQLRAFVITELSTTHYHEHPVQPEIVLSGSGVGWNESGMHHVDPHLRNDGTWIACVDGWFNSRVAGAQN